MMGAEGSSSRDRCHARGSSKTEEGAGKPRPAPELECCWIWVMLLKTTFNPVWSRAWVLHQEASGTIGLHSLSWLLWTPEPPGPRVQFALGDSTQPRAWGSAATHDRALATEDSRSNRAGQAEGSGSRLALENSPARAGSEGASAAVGTAPRGARRPRLCLRSPRGLRTLLAWVMHTSQGPCSYLGTALTIPVKACVSEKQRSNTDLAVLLLGIDPKNGKQRL